MNIKASSFSRRSILLGMTSALAAPIVMTSSRIAAASNTVTYVSYGGSYQAAIEKCVTKPFTEETGIQVNIVPAPMLAKVKAQLEIGSVEWDVYDTSGAIALAGSKQGFWEKIDPAMFDLSDLASPPASDSVPWLIQVGGIAWDPKKIGPGKHPSNFAEFFDPEKFPGRRALRNLPTETLEMALLADGVAPKDMYPLDVDRAFKVLDRIKHSIGTFTTASNQAISLVQTGEVDFSYAYSNRVKATTEPGAGEPLAFSYEQNLFDLERLTVLKGAPNKANAMKLVAYFLRPDVQARVMDQLGTMPISKKAVPMLSENTRSWLPQLNDKKSLFVSDAYWADNLESVSARYKAYILT